MDDLSQELKEKALEGGATGVGIADATLGLYFWRDCRKACPDLD